MRHWVQYHNPDKYGPYSPEKDFFGIFTNKPVDKLLGDRMWLVSRGREPRQYVLCETFVVDRVGEQRFGPRRYFAEGSRDGPSFSRPRRIDDKPWFGRLRRLTQNFRFGLTQIKDENIVQGLLKIISEP